MRGTQARSTTGAPVRSAVLVHLASSQAKDPLLAGAKAANLARAAAAGLPVLPGYVVLAGGHTPPLSELKEAWGQLGDGGRPLVVRSSSLVEDLEHSSMAGQFRSVVGVTDWPSFLDAITAVLDSAGPHRDSMAVLIQPQLDALCGGVMFTVDPMTNDPRRMLVEATEGAPHELVSGSVTATRYVLTRHGRLRHVDPQPGQLVLDRRRRQRLAALGRKAERLFSCPQDIEWAEDRDGTLWLLQSRPVTTTATAGRPVGPLLGPGPLGETFPDQVHPLEEDLWIAPLRAGITEALLITGAAPRRRVLDSPVVFTHDGWIACDLELLGYAPTPKHRLDPRPALRHLLSAWRVGRLRVALPELARDLIDDCDLALHDVPALHRLSTPELADVLPRLQQALVSLHAYEILAGALLAPDESGPTAAGLALRALASGRRRTHADHEIIAEQPVVLALSAPRIGGPEPVLPDVAVDHPVRGATSVDALPPREGLRLRIRWVQELGARVSAELGRRLSSRLPSEDAVAFLSLAELCALASGAARDVDIEARRLPADAPPLPAAFRLTRSGAVTAATTTNDGQGAVGGRAIGKARHENELAELLTGDVLVVQSLSPTLAPYLARLGGLVAETGSVLSHLAILAREAGVPTVVGVPDARTRFPAGATLLVDGTAGTVEEMGVGP